MESNATKVKDVCRLGWRLLMKRHLVAWLIALASVITATILTSATVLWNGKAPMVFFVIALITSAGRGFGPGSLATVCSICAVLSMFKGTISIPLATQSMVTLFVVIAIVVNMVFYKLNRQNEELTKQNRALVRAKAVIDAVNERLVDHAESLAEANVRLAEERAALTRTHEQLRLLGQDLANNVRAPLTRISATTDRLAQSNAARADAALAQASMLINTEVRRLGTLASEFARVC